jgi:hypothetical protein
MKKFWQCPACGGILIKDEVTMKAIDALRGFGGTARCSYCSVSQDVALVYSGTFDFHNSDDFIEKMGEDKASTEFDGKLERWRYRGELVQLEIDCNVEFMANSEAPKRSAVADAALLSVLDGGMKLDIPQLIAPPPPKKNPFFDSYFDQRIVAASAPKWRWRFWRRNNIECPSDFANSIIRVPEQRHSFSIRVSDLLVAHQALSHLLIAAGVLSTEDIRYHLVAQCPQCGSVLTGGDLEKFSVIPRFFSLTVLSAVWMNQAGSLLEGRCEGCNAREVSLVWEGKRQILPNPAPAASA